MCNKNRKRLLLLSDIHYCQEEYGGIARDEKIERLLAQINAEHQKEPFERILFLGDYSLDHWMWGTKGSWLAEGTSYTQIFAERYCGRLPAPYYLLPGNHEQFGEEAWERITGCKRSANFTVGDYLIILWDSYGADLDPTEHSDGTYAPIDVAAVRGLMEAEPEKKVILCSHYFHPTFRPEEQELIADPRVVCLFQGHTHYAGVLTLPKEYGAKKLIQTGSWAKIIPGGNIAWGVRELIFEPDRVFTEYLVAEQPLYHNGQPYTLAERRQDGVEIAF